MTCAAAFLKSDWYPNFKYHRDNSLDLLSFSLINSLFQHYIFIMFMIFNMQVSGFLKFKFININAMFVYHYTYFQKYYLIWT